MKKLELKDVAGYLPHGLKVYEPREEEVFPVLGVEMNEMLYHCSKSEYDWWSIDLLKPILRPIFDLYKEIVHKGEKITPIVECAKILYPAHEWVLYEDDDCRFAKHGVLTLIYSQYENAFRLERDEVDIWLTKQSQLFDYLHELKIDYRGLIDAGLAIDANTLDNPYK